MESLEKLFVQSKYKIEKLSKATHLERLRKQVVHLENLNSSIARTREDTEALISQHALINQSLVSYTNHSHLLKLQLEQLQRQIFKLERLAVVNKQANDRLRRDVVVEEQEVVVSKETVEKGNLELHNTEELEADMVRGLLTAKHNSGKLQASFNQLTQMRALIYPHYENTNRALENIELQLQQSQSQYQTYQEILLSMNDQVSKLVDKFEKRKQRAISRIHQIHAYIDKKAEKAEKRREYEEIMRLCADNAENSVYEKEVPEFGNPGYIWPARQTVIAEYFTVPNIANVTDIRDILLLMVKQRKQLDLQLMDLPYGKGGFRKVYYAQERTTGTRYVIKQFHIQRDVDTDNKDCERVSKSYALAKYCAELYQRDFLIAQRKFSNTLDARGLLADDLSEMQRHALNLSTFSFVDSYFAVMKPWYSNPTTALTTVMIEPLLPQFEKWINNNLMIKNATPDGFDPSPHNQSIHAFVHWTYIKSCKSFIIADIQGFKCVLPRQTPPSSDYYTMYDRSISTDSEEPTMRNDSVIHWILSDPAIHTLKIEDEEQKRKEAERVELERRRRGDPVWLDRDASFADKIHRELYSHLVGDLGTDLEAERYLEEKHKCSFTCMILGIS